MFKPTATAKGKHTKAQREAEHKYSAVQVSSVLCVAHKASSTRRHSTRGAGGFAPSNTTSAVRPASSPVAADATLITSEPSAPLNTRVLYGLKPCTRTHERTGAAATTAFDAPTLCYSRRSKAAHSQRAAGGAVLSRAEPSRVVLCHKATSCTAANCMAVASLRECTHSTACSRAGECTRA
jgi:hypothetical protein